MYRPVGAAPFSSEERIAVKAAAAYLSLTVTRCPPAQARRCTDAWRRQALYVRSRRQVIRASANGYELLAQASGCAVNRPDVPAELERAVPAADPAAARRRVAAQLARTMPPERSGRPP